MFGSQKSREKVSVEEFVTGRNAEAPAGGDAADEQKCASNTRRWLIAAMVVAVGLLALCFAAFVKIGHLSREVALLRSQASGEALNDRINRLEKELEAMTHANAREAKAKTKTPTRKGVTDKKRARPH